MRKTQISVFDAITCPSCGGKFKSIPDAPGYYRCDSCQGYEAYLLNGEVHFVDRWGDLDDETTIEAGVIPPDDRPPVCQGCGGNYPDCMDSCSFFDD